MESDVVPVEGTSTFIHAVQEAVTRNGDAEQLRRRQFHPATAGKPRRYGRSSCCTASAHSGPGFRCAFLSRVGTWYPERNGVAQWRPRLVAGLQNGATR